MNNSELVPFGKHKDKEWSEVPKGYLEFVANLVPPGPLSIMSLKELETRNAKISDFRLIDSAVDSASFCLLDKWKRSNLENKSNIGFLSYVKIFIKRAISEGTPISDENLVYEGVRIKVQWGKIYPTIIKITNHI